MGQIAARLADAVRSSALVRIAVPSWGHFETTPKRDRSDLPDRDEFKELLDAALKGESLRRSSPLAGRDEPEGMRRIRRVLLDTAKPFR